MQAIILVGGFGSRLKNIIKNVPKPMAPIGDKPFLAYLMDYLNHQGFKKIFFSAYHLHEIIQDYFQFSYQNMSIDYVIEDEPLGTGGAILHALNHFSIREPLFVLNGDTFLKLDYKEMVRQHQNERLLVALRWVEDASRYGKVEMQNDTIIQFKEKGKGEPGFINAGVYFIHPMVFSSYPMQKHFSFENDFLFPFVHKIKPRAFIADHYFIDIGIPEDYLRAQREVQNFQI